MILMTLFVNGLGYCGVFCDIHVIQCDPLGFFSWIHFTNYLLREMTFEKNQKIYQFSSFLNVLGEFKFRYFRKLVFFFIVFFL